MKRTLFCLFLCLALTVGLFTFVSCKDKADVIIYSGAEEYRNEAYLAALKKKFPDYKIEMEYMPTGDLAAKAVAEGSDSAADILLDIDYGYLAKMSDALEDLTDYDFYDTSIYTEDTIENTNGKVLPHTRNGGCILVNTELLEKNKLPEPTSYDDLLKPEYKNLISMPNPKSSGTGYMFYKALVNVRGEEAAIEYFDKLTENIRQYTSSGSGPVNALIDGEAAIGLAMTAQAVTEINEGAPLKILFFEEGSPYSLYGLGVVKGKMEKKPVQEVFKYFIEELVAQDKADFYPEKIYKDRDFTIENYPTDIQYADMRNNTPEEKERLLALWTH